MGFKQILFRLGVAMITYDMLGHFCCALARRFIFMNNFWNNHSIKIWPSITDGFKYDTYWTIFFIIAITLILTGKR